MLVLESANPDEPAFQCEKCGFVDDVGQFTACPLCVPGAPYCPFFRAKGACGLDFQACDHAEFYDFVNCKKLDESL